LTLVFFTDRDLGTLFPEILKGAGFSVERHRDHFPPECPDEDWLAEVGRRQWVALTHDARIRYKPNELAAVIRHRVRLLVIVGKAPFPDLAASFVATRSRIEAFLEGAAARPSSRRCIGPRLRNSTRTRRPPAGLKDGIRGRLGIRAVRRSPRPVSAADARIVI